MSKNLTINTVRTRAATFGTTVLSKRIVSAQTTLAFICPCGNHFTQTWRNFRRNPLGRCQPCQHPSGERNGQYKALTPEEREARKPSTRLVQYTTWSKQVFERDGHRCVLSGATTGLVAHHLYNWADHPDLRTEVSNGVTLTRELHNRFHKLYGSRCTPADFEAFRSLYATPEAIAA